MHIIVMGVSGVGKTAVGQGIATALSLRFDDADDFHPLCNVEKMKSGQALEDEDRWPWLELLNTHLKQSRGCVLACSALKQSYRQVLCDGIDDVKLIYLKADRDTLIKRMQQREHFMPVSLLDSQLATWEEPREVPGFAPVMTIDATLPLDDVIDQSLAALAK